MCFDNYLLNTACNKTFANLFVLVTLLLTGCGAGGGAVDSKTGVLAPTTITISPSAPSNVAVGLSTNFTAQATYADGSKADITTQVSWATGDPNIASIDNNGRAIGHQTGSSTTVTASLSGVSSSPVTLNVNSKVISSISISTTTASVPKGQAANFVATASYSDGSTGSVTGSVTWSSDTPAVVSVNQAGKASTGAVGSATISAIITVGSMVVTSNSITLTVIPPVLASITLSPTSASITVLGTKQFTASGVMSDGTPATLGTLNWSSNCASGAASISNTGVATGVGVGSCTISASSGGSITSSPSSLAVQQGYLRGGAVQGSPLPFGQLKAAVVTTLLSTFPPIIGSNTVYSISLRSITTDGSNLYVTDSYRHQILKIVIVSGAVTVLAGSGNPGNFDATGSAASFNNPAGITTDGINLYVADYANHSIRMIVISSGVVTTLAGTGVPGAVDATGTSASFNYPSGITTDGNNLYIADSSNNKIRKLVIASRVVATLAGSGAPGVVDATGVAASFSCPLGITTDGSNLYIADSCNHLIRQIVIASGQVSTMAGTGSYGSVDAVGINASFYYPYDITMDGSNLYVADWLNNKIRKIVISTDVVTTLAGSGSGGYLDATGTAAKFYSPTSITTDGSNLYVVDSNNYKIREIQ